MKQSPRVFTGAALRVLPKAYSGAPVLAGQGDSWSPWLRWRAIVKLFDAPVISSYPVAILWHNVTLCAKLVELLAIQTAPVTPMAIIRKDAVRTAS
jgi:hypothetical protein